MSTFGKRLKELRKEKQLTVEQLANNIGSAKSTISRYENGREPKGDILRLLTDYFNVSIDYLMGISDNRNPSVDKENKSNKKINEIIEDFEIALDTATMPNGENMDEKSKMFFKQSLRNLYDFIIPEDKK